MNATTYWPASSQIPLLKAAFLSDAQSLSAFQQWKSQISMDDHPDLGSFRLLPQLYRNLSGQGVKDPLMMRLKGVGRQGWLKNQQFFDSAAQLFQHLHQANIKAMLLYGPAIALKYSPDYRLESTAILPVLVPAHQAGAAAECLRRHGWNSETGLQPSSIKPHLNQAYMHNFDDSLGRRIQLHWHLLPECCSLKADDDFWAGAIETQIRDTPVYVLNPTDQLFHICAQDTVVSTTLFLRAIDAMFVLQAAQDEINWERLIAQAKKRRLVVPVMKALGFLRQNLGEVIPPEILTQLQTLPIARWESLEYQSKNSPLMAWRRSSRLWFNYLRYSNGSGLAAKLTGFPKYLQHYWCLEHFGDMPRRFIGSVQYRLRQTSS